MGGWRSDLLVILGHASHHGQLSGDLPTCAAEAPSTNQPKIATGPETGADVAGGSETRNSITKVLVPSGYAALIVWKIVGNLGFKPWEN